MPFVSIRASITAIALLASAQLVSGKALADKAPAPAMHKAVYELRTVSANSNSPVTGVRGSMSYEWADACDGWVVDQRYDLVFQYRDGPSLAMKNSFLSWESKDGQEYEFKARKFIDESLDEEIEGTAELGKTSNRADFTLPQESSVDLSPGSMFPVAHTLALLAQAREGKRFFYKTVFDGSLVDAGSDISAVIGQSRPSEVKSGQVSGDRDLLKGKVIPVVMAYFDREDGNGVPRYELTVQLHENGVAERLLLNYGDYVLDAVLTKLDKLPASGC